LDALFASTDRPLFWLAWMLIGLAAAAGLIEPLVELFRAVPNDYNEGWNAFWAEAAMRGNALYPSADSSVVNNYPPLSFFIVGALGRVVGDNVLAGRIVSLASFAAIPTLIYLWLKSTGSKRGFAMFGASVFAASLVAWSPDDIGCDDPQLLAHAVMMTGLWLVWRRDFRTPDVVIGAALMVCAGFIKHLLIPVPLVMTVWIAVNARRQLGVWILSAAVTAVSLFALTYWLYGPNFFSNLFFARSYSRYKAIDKAGNIVEFSWAAIALLGAFVAQYCIPQNAKSLWRRGSFVVAYAAVAGVVGTLSAGGAGVDRNAFFDFLIALSLSAALSLEALELLTLRAAHWPLFRAGAIYGLSVMLTLSLVHRLSGRLTDEEHRFQTLQSREADAHEAIRLIREAGGGHAACETLSLCYWADNGFEVDFFGYGQKLETGALPVSSCEKVFLAPQMRLVQIDKYRGEPASMRLPRACNEFIQSHYTVLLDTELYVLFARRGV
jgi:hypothetical protein